MGETMEDSRLHGGNRLVDTAIGVLLAWGISFFFPRKWMEMLRHSIEAHRHTHEHHYTGKHKR